MSKVRSSGEVFSVTLHTKAWYGSDGVGYSAPMRVVELVVAPSMEKAIDIVRSEHDGCLLESIETIGAKPLIVTGGRTVER